MRRSTCIALILVLSIMVAAQAVAQVSNTGRLLDPTTLGHNVLTEARDINGIGVSILYAPSHDDDPVLRADVADITGGTVDYFDPRTATPDSTLLSNYDCVYTWAGFPYLDNVAFGDNLADRVDVGGVVILGSFATYTSGNFLSGRIMTPGYSPVWSPTGGNHFVTSGYAGDGVTPIHDGVVAYEVSFRDVLALQGTGVQDGSYLDGEIGHAYRPDFKVIYSNGGGAAQLLGTGDWPLLVANACRAGHSGPVLYAVDDSDDSLYTVDIATGVSTLVGACGFDLSFSGMAWDSWHRTMYVSDVEGPSGWSLGTVDLASGAVTVVGPHVNSVDIMGLAFDSTNNVLYGVDTDCVPSAGLATINRATGESTCIGPWGTGSEIRGIAYNNDTDTLYCADETNLFTVDRATGLATFVGPHGALFGAAYIGLEYDAASGILYGAGSGDGYLYTLDMSTGAATLIGSTGMVNISSLGSINAPGEPCGLFCDGFESGDTSRWN
ncbi:MAG: hypothetical protein QNL88_03980 [Acidobacteriota bacterium]|nr:hypothetical protein [Acidobacteriota bacterium]